MGESWRKKELQKLILRLTKPQDMEENRLEAGTAAAPTVQRLINGVGGLGLPGDRLVQSRRGFLPWCWEWRTGTVKDLPFSPRLFFPGLGSEKYRMVRGHYLHHQHYRPGGGYYLQRPDHHAARSREGVAGGARCPQ